MAYCKSIYCIRIKCKYLDQYNFAILFNINRKIEYYKNGSLITTGTGSTSSTYAWNSLTFGNINGGSAGWYSGKMSIIKIYNRTLSATEVLQNYNATKRRFGL